MVALIQRLQDEGATTRQAARQVRKEGKGKTGRGRPRNFVFRFQPKEKSFSLALQFRRSEVPRAEIVRTLERILEELRRTNE
jgi:Ser/Thr protein kinase RdoA (MazF antagonist)